MTEERNGIQHFEEIDGLEEFETLEETEVIEGPAEQIPAIDLRRPPPNLTSWQRFKRAIYNPENGQILGRTFADWGRLLIFYIFFYAVLAAICAIGISTLLKTLEEDKPKWKLGESLIGTNPGLGFRPISPVTEEGALISYNQSEPESIEKWVNLVDEFLIPYQKKPTNMKNCHFGSYVDEDSVCAVDIKQFGPCNSGNKYGYNSSSPCVFIKLNRIYGWLPDFYEKPVEGMPRDLVSSIKKLPKIKRRQVWVSCNGENSSDKKNIRDFKYYPGRGFPGYFYPYLNVKNYLSPLIAVEIINPTPNQLINIECRAWAKNIYYHGGDNDRQGSVHFEILKITD